MNIQDQQVNEILFNFQTAEINCDTVESLSYDQFQSIFTYCQAEIVKQHQVQQMRVNQERAMNEKLKEQQSINDELSEIKMKHHKKKIHLQFLLDSLIPQQIKEVEGIVFEENSKKSIKTHSNQSSYDHQPTLKPNYFSQLTFQKKDDSLIPKDSFITNNSRLSNYNHSNKNNQSEDIKLNDDPQHSMKSRIKQSTSELELLLERFGTATKKQKNSENENMNESVGSVDQLKMVFGGIDSMLIQMKQQQKAIDTRELRLKEINSEIKQSKVQGIEYQDDYHLQQYGLSNTKLNKQEFI